MLVQEKHSGARQSAHCSCRLRLSERLCDLIGLSRVHSQTAACFLHRPNLQFPSADPKRQATPRVFAYCPSPASTAGIVFIKILQSSSKLQLLMYPRSRNMQVSNEGSARAVTCHNPVRPGLTSRRL